MKEKISIIVPIHNTESFLEACLHSLRIQTYKNLEILLIDDGSTDGSASICQKYAAEDNRFRYVFQENAGVSSARNHGLDFATGDYIGFCDSDDWVDPDMYETLYSLLLEAQADIAMITCHPVEGPQNGNDFSIRTFDGAGAIAELLKAGAINGSLCTKLFRKTLFADVRLHEAVSIFEDTLASWDLFFRSKKIVLQNAAKYHYRDNPDSAMRSAYKESEWSGRDATYLILDKMKTFFPENVIYAQRTILASSYRLAERMALAGKLTDENFQILLADFHTHGNETAANLFDRRTRLKFSIFRKGRTIFSLYMRAVKVRRTFPHRKAGNFHEQIAKKCP